MLSCDTITWVSSLKPWRALLAERGIASHEARPAKLRRLEGALDRSLGAVSCDADTEVIANDDDDASYEDHQPDDQLDCLATQPFEGGSSDEDSEEEKCEEENDEKAEEAEDIDDGPDTVFDVKPTVAPTRSTDEVTAGTLHDRATPTGTELFKRITSICAAGSGDSPTLPDVEKVLEKDFDR